MRCRAHSATVPSYKLLEGATAKVAVADGESEVRWAVAASCHCTSMWHRHVVRGLQGAAMVHGGCLLPEASRQQCVTE